MSFRWKYKPVLAVTSGAAWFPISPSPLDMVPNRAASVAHSTTGMAIAAAASARMRPVSLRRYRRRQRAGGRLVTRACDAGSVLVVLLVLVVVAVTACRLSAA